MGVLGVARCRLHNWKMIANNSGRWKLNNKCHVVDNISQSNLPVIIISLSLAQLSPSLFFIITIPCLIRQILREKLWIPDKKYFVHPWSGQGQSGVRARSGQGQGKTRTRPGQGKGKVKARSR